MNPHAEATDQAIRRLANAVEAAGAGDAEHARVLAKACDDLRTARQLRHRRAYAKATRRATVGLSRLGLNYGPCPRCGSEHYGACAEVPA